MLSRSSLKYLTGRTLGHRFPHKPDLDGLTHLESLIRCGGGVDALADDVRNVRLEMMSIPVHCERYIYKQICGSTRAIAIRHIGVPDKGV